MLFSEARGRKVVSIATAQTVGKIDDFVVDPATHSVIALGLKKTDSGNTLRWWAIAAFGADAVTVTGAEKITDADEQVAALTGKDHRVLGSRVLSTLGDELGTVADVDFDPTTGEILALHLADDQVEGVRLVGVGSYAVVVQAGRA
ncbi:MAG: PRC-barrel domain-containing protein [Jatrophihabitantaceae bacterium]